MWYILLAVNNEGKTLQICTTKIHVSFKQNNGRSFSAPPPQKKSFNTAKMAAVQMTSEMNG
jgi:hypothetical protein